MKKIFFVITFICCLLGHTYAQFESRKTFTNPVLAQGADPWVTYKDGYYYHTHSTGTDLELWKTKNPADLSSAEHKVIWTPPVGTVWSKELWAPELHFIVGKWYMYFAADGGLNKGHRIYVIENASADPMTGDWTFKGKVSDPSNKWAIDVSVFENKGLLYMIWSGWAGDSNGQQNIYIAAMSNPYTISGERVLLSAPTYKWEVFGNLTDPNNPPHVNVNEGPEMLKHGNKLFLVYSASGCWTDHYCLGMLTADQNSDLLNPQSWIKSPEPVFKGNPANNVYAPGHNSFFKSPNGKEDWIMYHANPGPGCGCDGKRSTRIQRFTWKPDGTPNFGVPFETGKVLRQPE